MLKYRDWIITLGAIICFIEFMSMGSSPIPEYAQLVGILHLAASLFLLAALILYVSMWRIGWVLFLRVIFAGFIAFMMVTSCQLGIDLLF
ncbi:MAG TPA: hypothetical protein VIS49_13995 [Cyclobacteriaceae bacterium]